MDPINAKSRKGIPILHNGHRQGKWNDRACQISRERSQGSRTYQLRSNFAPTSSALDPAIALSTVFSVSIFVDLSITITARGNRYRTYMTCVDPLTTQDMCSWRVCSVTLRGTGDHHKGDSVELWTDAFPSGYSNHRMFTPSDVI